MPPEWAPHERCLMAWPCRETIWAGVMDEAKDAYVATARAIAGPGAEPVLMVADPADAAEARARLGAEGGDGDGEIEVVEEPIDDSWLRDNGPIVVTEPGGRRTGVDFEFNAWGEKYPPWDKDATLAARMLERLGLERQAVPMVLEGGAICVDGAGTLITTEQCLLNPNRNPTMTREEIESTLRLTLGQERVVWLGRGLIEDHDTDGHVDLIAAFTPSGALLLQSAPPGDPNSDYCAGNYRRAMEAGLTVTEMPHLPRTRVTGEPIAVSHMNFYIANEAVVVPVMDPELDAAALEIVAEAFPGRTVVPVPGTVLAYGGGGPHCITQQIPAA
jgi:agmatine deiminase